MAEWLVEMGTFLLQTTLVLAAAAALLMLVMRSKESPSSGLKLQVAVSYTHLTLPTTPYV